MSSIIRHYRLATGNRPACVNRREVDWPQTWITAHVTCLRCIRTKAFKEALSPATATKEDET